MGNLSLPDETIIEIATDLRELPWPPDAQEIEGLIGRRGWLVDSRGPGGITFVPAPGFAFGDITFDSSGTPVSVDVPVTSYRNEPGWLVDTFAHVAGLLTASWGEPTTRRPGEISEVRWQGQKTTVSVSGTVTLVSLKVASHEEFASFDADAERVS